LESNMYKFFFPIRVDASSINQARHLPHHNYLLFFQKARQAYLQQFGFTEQDIAGKRMFIVEAHCIYKKELFLWDEVIVKCRVNELRPKVFVMGYSIEREGLVCARGTTKSVCVNPDTRKSVPLPKAFVSEIIAYEPKDIN
jgi:YbgC/YbaW family acyl-CoA thioester hydrolase